MADITRANFSFDGSNPALPKLSGKLAGEAIAAGQAVYLKSDDKIWLADGSAADALSEFIGLAGTTASAGYAVTVLLPGWRCRYAASMTPGDRLYVSVTAGALADAASTGGTTPVAIVASATEILITGYQHI